MKELLVATDLSKRSTAALTRAVLLSTQMNARLNILHVMDSDLPEKVVSLVNAAAKKDIQEKLLSIAGSETVKSSVQVSKGEPHIEILRAAKRMHPQLIIIGTHRKAKIFKDFFLGTTVERVARHTNRPLLVVKNKATKPYKNICAAVDFSSQSKKAVEKSLNYCADSKYNLLHICSASSLLLEDEELGKEKDDLVQSAQKQLEGFAKELCLKDSNAIVKLDNGNLAGQISDECDSLKANLLVVGSNGRAGMVNNILGSKTIALLQQPPCDIFISKQW